MRANKTGTRVAGIMLSVIAFLAACVAVPSVGDTSMTTGERSMKGYELYSWQVNGEWRYALVAGTNRMKTYNEIATPSNVIKSVAELQPQLAQLDKGEEIVWGTWGDNHLTLPPQEIVAEIVKVCQGLGLNLMIAR